MTLHISSPLLESTPLSIASKRKIFLKMDALQPSGSFKIRGIGHACEQAAGQGIRRFVAASGGNAGLAVAYAARKLGAKAWIVVPGRASVAVREYIRNEGAEVIVYGDVWDDAHEHALHLCKVHDAWYIHPFDDPHLWTGHATLIHEIADSGHKPDAVVVSVGGGGLMCGVIQGLHDVGWSHIPVVAVETEGAAGLNASVKAGHPVILEQLTSIATSLSSRIIAKQAFDWTYRHKVIATTVSDRAALDACKRFLGDHRVLVEPACGAALAPAYDANSCLSAFTKVVIVVCGGSGVSLELIQKWDDSLAQT